MMSSDYKLHQLIVAHEGIRTKLYKCSAGKWTIGVGYNIEDNGLPRLFCLLLLDYMISDCVLELHRIFPEFDGLLEARRHALIDMVYNLGPTRFRTFKRMIAAVEQSAWHTAADEMLDSKWAGQVGQRAEDLAEMMLKGRC